MPPKRSKCKSSKSLLNFKSKFIRRKSAVYRKYGAPPYFAASDAKNMAAAPIFCTPLISPSRIKSAPSSAKPLRYQALCRPFAYDCGGFAA